MLRITTSSPKCPGLHLCMHVLQVAARTTDALNLTTLPRRVSAAEIDDYSVAPAHEPGGRRAWQVRAEQALLHPIAHACMHHVCMRAA